MLAHYFFKGAYVARLSPQPVVLAPSTPTPTPSPYPYPIPPTPTPTPASTLTPTLTLPLPLTRTLTLTRSCSRHTSRARPRRRARSTRAGREIAISPREIGAGREIAISPRRAARRTRGARGPPSPNPNPNPNPNPDPNPNPHQAYAAAHQPGAGRPTPTRMLGPAGPQQRQDHRLSERPIAPSGHAAHLPVPRHGRPHGLHVQAHAPGALPPNPKPKPKPTGLSLSLSLSLSLTLTLTRASSMAATHATTTASNGAGSCGRLSEKGEAAAASRRRPLRSPSQRRVPAPAYDSEPSLRKPFGFLIWHVILLHCPASLLRSYTSFCALLESPHVLTNT